MGKIVKYCGACEESFANKFGFCPNCGGTLKAFEMNPVQEEAKGLAADKAAETAEVFETPKVGALENRDFTAPAQPVTGTYETSPKIQPSIVPAAAIFSANGAKAADIQSRTEKVVSEEPTAKVAEISTTENLPLKDSSVETKSFAASANGNGHPYQTANHNYQPATNSQNDYTDDGFRVTVIEEKNVKQRNLLLLGSMLLILSLSVGGTIYSLFNRGLLVGAIDQGDLISFVPIVDDAPMDVEEPPKPKIDKAAGGGGGGGREEETPTSKGRLAPQMPDPPLITPTKTIPQKDFELKMQATTVGNTKVKATDENYGDPNSKYTLSSDGMGRGGGQGSGVGTGQGSGRGTGQGSGIGSGSGSGNGDGSGSGTGDGTEGRNAPPPPPKKVEPVAVVSVPFKLISKPKPPYTDAARQNAVTGTVRLRVIFLASGQIGSISPVSGLPYGLTEQAIAAARGIKFEPAKKNGVPITSSKIMEYSFTIY